MLSIELHKTVLLKEVLSAIAVTLKNSGDWDGYRSKRLSSVNLEQRENQMQLLNQQQPELQPISAVFLPSYQPNNNTAAYCKIENDTDTDD